jgi:hypothetical protein
MVAAQADGTTVRIQQANNHRRSVRAGARSTTQPPQTQPRFRSTKSPQPASLRPRESPPYSRKPAKPISNRPQRGEQNLLPIIQVSASGRGLLDLEGYSWQCLRSKVFRLRGALVAARLYPSPSAWLPCACVLSTRRLITRAPAWKQRPRTELRDACYVHEGNRPGSTARTTAMHAKHAFRTLHAAAAPHAEGPRSRPCRGSQLRLLSDKGSRASAGGHARRAGNRDRPARHPAHPTGAIAASPTHSIVSSATPG